MEDFVPFELAKKLEGLGFDESSLFFYREDDEDKCVHCVDTNQPLIDAKITIAPTISQVLKWLRDEKKYHIEFVGNACGYLFIISDVPSEGGTDKYCSDYSGPNDGGTWDKYEDCILAAIEYVLDNLISK